MDYRPFGSTGVELPSVGLGTWQTFDVDADDAAVPRSVVGAALERGMRVFDSSPMYGRSEQRLADALGDRRGDVFLATKVWTPDDDEAEQQAARSLAMYGDRIDLYQVHNLVEWRTRLDMIERLRDEGRVGLIGATCTRASEFDELATVMRTGRIQSVQVPYNPVEREVEQEILPLATDLGLGVVLMRPLGSGKLARLEIDAADLAVLRGLGVTTWAQALLVWDLSNPACHVAIPATSRVVAVEENAAAGAMPSFDDDVRAFVSGVVARAS